MRGIRLTELLQEIRANLVPFLSIVMFICLGIGFYMGIDWASWAIANTADQAFEADTLHDIEVDFPYGVTDDDIRQIEALEGVTDVEPAYVAFAGVQDGDEYRVFKFQSLTQRIDTTSVVEGVLPTQPDEMALLAFWAREMGIEVGDTVVFEHDVAQDSDDQDGMSQLTSDTFTVTGLVDNPAYASTVSGMLGETDRGTGKVECVAFVTDDAFDTEQFDGGHPVLYIRCDELRGMSTFDDAYKEHNTPLVDAVCELGGKLGSARYEQIVSDAQAQIDEGMQQVTDGERQIADGAQEISDGERQIADSTQEIAEGEQQLDATERQLSEGADELADGRRQIAEGEQQLASGEQQVAAGESELAQGKREYADKKAAAEQQLAEAKKELDKYQQLYDESQEIYEGDKLDYEKATAAFESVRSSYLRAVQANEELDETYSTLLEREGAVEAALYNYQDLVENEAATQEELDEAWASVDETYQEFASFYASASEQLTQAATSFDEVAEAYGSSVEAPVLPEATAPSRDDPDGAFEQLSTVTNAYSDERDRVCFAEVSVGRFDASIVYLEHSLQEQADNLEVSREILDEAAKKLEQHQVDYNEKQAEYNRQVSEAEARIADGERQLEDSRRRIAAARAELDQTKATYDAKLREYEEAQQTFNERKAELERGKGDLEKARSELEEARQRLEDSRAELEEAREQLSEAQEQFDSLKEYEWVVLSRLENAGVYNVDSMVVMMRNVRWVMATLFSLVGLFVCYSAVSRLINAEVAQIGAKKAMGFRESEIASLYLLFSGLAVLVGTVLGGLMGVFLIEAIANSSAADPFSLPPFRLHFSLPELVAGGAIELALILAATWLAIHGLVRRNAVDLLNGNYESRAHTRFYERGWLWRRLSLYSQTIINNCINDKRRVVATLVGVTGCTTLIVTAFTLRFNISRSIERQYDTVYFFDTTVNLDTDVEDAAGTVGSALDGMGMAQAPVHLESLQVRLPDDCRMGAKLVVPTDERSFDELYHLEPLDGGDARLEDGGIWLSAGYAQHKGIHAGDTVTVTEATGKTHEIAVAGVFEYYIMSNEFVMGKEAFIEEFGGEAEPNALFVRKGDTDFKQLRSELSKVEGYKAMTDDLTYSMLIFERVTGLLSIVVVLYLVLSALMAVVVLLNLDVMFVEEKKRELLVLMINGFSVGAAKAYVYRESLVLTALGIGCGVVLGSFVGNETIGLLEPNFGYFIKGVSVKAVVLGAAVAAFFSTSVMLVALRRIPRFSLTDIGKY